MSATFDWKFHSVPISISKQTPQLRCYKQYQRGAKTFWRNYRRDVKGGSTFLERFGAMMDTTRRNVEAELSRQIFV